MFRKFGSRERLRSSKTDWLVDPKEGTTALKPGIIERLGVIWKKKGFARCSFTNSNLSSMLKSVRHI